MTIEAVKGQFLQGEPKKLKVPNRQKPVFHDNNLPQLGGIFSNARTLPRKGAYIDKY